MSDWGARFVKRGGIWVGCQGLLTLAVVAAGILFHGRTIRYGQEVGGALLFLAAVTGIAGLVAQGRRLTPFPRPPKNAQLIQHGIYGLIRHPLYTANLCGFFGWAFLWGSLPALGLSLAGVVFFSAKARQEEWWLREQLPAYAEYEKRVNRFVPWL